MPLFLPRRTVSFSPRLQRRQQRWPLLLSLSLLAMAAQGCRPQPSPQPPVPSPAAQADALRQRQQLAARGCQQRRRDLLEGLAELRRAEAALADARAASHPPLSSPPVWDEAAEQRFSLVDQELDRQGYEQELAAWQRRRAEQHTALAQQRQQLAEAQQRLNRQAQRLRQRYPALFTGPTSIEVRPQEWRRLNRCPDGPA